MSALAPSSSFWVTGRAPTPTLFPYTTLFRSRSAGGPAAPRPAYRGRRRVASFVAGGDAEGAHSSHSRYVPGKSPARRPGAGHRAHQLVPLSERRCRGKAQGREIWASLRWRTLLAVS